MSPSGSRPSLGLTVRPAWISNGLVAVISVVTIALVLSSAGSGRAQVLSVIEIAAPGALLAVALLITHVAGQMNLANGGVLVVGLVALGLDESPTDGVIVLTVAAVVAGSLISGLLVSSTEAGIFAGLFGFFLLRGLSLSIGGNVGRSSDVDGSFIASIMRFDPLGFSAGLLFAVVATVSVGALLGWSGIGRRIRAFGLGRSRALLSETRPLFPVAVAHLAAGALVALAVVIRFSRLGTSSASNESALLLEPLVALIVGNGGLSRIDPSPLRVFVAFILVEFLRHSLALGGFSSVSTDLIFALFAIAALGAAGFGRHRHVVV